MNDPYLRPMGSSTKEPVNSKSQANQKNTLLEQRVHTSQLLGKNKSLVLHGGGNTSGKIKEKNITGEEEEIL
jgi:rhamnose utilization protein RhaD (predicted bifunctional aldolase and dehydrogenase)